MCSKQCLLSCFRVTFVTLLKSREREQCNTSQHNTSCLLDLTICIDTHYHFRFLYLTEVYFTWILLWLCHYNFLKYFAKLSPGRGSSKEMNVLKNIKNPCYVCQCNLMNQFFRNPPQTKQFTATNRNEFSQNKKKNKMLMIFKYCYRLAWTLSSTITETFMYAPFTAVLFDVYVTL